MWAQCSFIHVHRDVFIQYYQYRMCNLSEGVDEHRDLHFGGELNDGMLLNYFIQTKIKLNSFVEVLSHKAFHSSFLFFVCFGGFFFPSQTRVVLIERAATRSVDNTVGHKTSL